MYGASFFGQAVYKIDVKTGQVSVAVGSPEGESDDLAFGPAGTPASGILAWTSVEGVHSLTPDGQRHVLAADVPRANPIAFSKDGRLFFAQSGTPENELWEIDPLGTKPPRLVTKGQGRLNGFDFGPDGRIYSPLFGTDEVVAVDVNTGLYSPIAKGVGSPSAVKVDPRGNLIAVDYKLGDVWHIDRMTGATRKLANFPPVIDNLAIGSDGTIYLASTADSIVHALNPETGASREVVKGKFNTPLGATLTTYQGKPALLIAQPQSFAYVDLASGAISRPFYDAGRNGSSAVAADDRFIVTALGGRLRKFDRVGDKLIAETLEVKTPAGIALTAAGEVIVADASTGRLLRWTEAGVATIAEGLAQPTALLLDTARSALVAETAAGQITRVSLESGERTVVAKGLDHPQGIAMLSDGRIAVAEPVKGVVATLDLKNGARTELASGLPLSVNGLRIAATTPTGMATGPDGALYVVGSQDNSLLKIALNTR